MVPALVSKPAASVPHTELWPRDPLRYHMLLPEAPRACGWGRATPRCRHPPIPAVPRTVGSPAGSLL